MTALTVYSSDSKKTPTAVDFKSSHGAKVFVPNNKVVETDIPNRISKLLKDRLVFKDDMFQLEFKNQAGSTAFKLESRQNGNATEYRMVYESMREEKKNESNAATTETTVVFFDGEGQWTSTTRETYKRVTFPPTGINLKWLYTKIYRFGTKLPTLQNEGKIVHQGQPFAEFNEALPNDLIEKLKAANLWTHAIHEWVPFDKKGKDKPATLEMTLEEGEVSRVINYTESGENDETWSQWFFADQTHKKTTLTTTKITQIFPGQQERPEYKDGEKEASELIERVSRLFHPAAAV